MWLLAAAILWSSANAAPTKHAEVTINLDASGAGAGVGSTKSSPSPFPHIWKKTFGSGHAALGLRADWVVQLKQARDELGLQGVRQHGLFDDDMGPVVTGHRQ